MTSVLICAATASTRRRLASILESSGLATWIVDSDAAAFALIDEMRPAVVIVSDDIGDTLCFLAKVAGTQPSPACIIVADQHPYELSLRAVELGAFDILPASDAPSVLIKTLNRALAEEQSRRARGRLASVRLVGHGEILGTSSDMKRLYERLRKLETIDVPTILLTGESGTGKELVARTIHRRGPRRNAPYVEIDCTTIPENLVESTLFGHERGAFTDAKASRVGLFETAKNGVVFLDEIGELPLSTQAKLLRAIENRRFRRVGGTAEITLRASVVAATNRDLREESSMRQFRQDLFFRLSVVTLTLPPLRERDGDVALLAYHFMRGAAEAYGVPAMHFSDRALAALTRYPWPGNVRELRNTIENIVVFLEGDTIREADLPSHIRACLSPIDESYPVTLPPDGLALDDVERALVEQALDQADGNRTEAGRLLGLSRHALRARLKKFGMD